MSPKHVSKELDAFGSRNVRQTEQSRMIGSTVDHASKIRVNRDQDSAFLRCHFKDCPVTRIGAKTGHFDHIVTLGPKPFGQTMASTAIDEESHLAS
jgi:hypothetical protein